MANSAAICTEQKRHFLSTSGQFAVICCKLAPMPTKAPSRKLARKAPELPKTILVLHGPNQIGRAHV
jgi:hypothetical protein